MFKIGFACAASVALAGTALAGAGQADLGKVYDGGEAQFIGTITGAQLAEMRGIRNRDTGVYSTNWTTDSNGASYTTGNMTTGNGTTAAGLAGQGGWLMYAGAATAYKIVTSGGGRSGQALQMSGPSSTSNTNANYFRYLYQDVSAQWAARNAGEETTWVTNEVFMGSATSSTSSRMGGFLFVGDPLGTSGGMATGFAVETGTQGTVTKQRSVFGYAYYTSGTTTGNFRFKLSEQALSGGGTSSLAVAGGWTKFAVSWNRATSEVFWYYSVDGGANYVGFTVTGAVLNSWDAYEWDYYGSNASGTTLSAGSATFGDLSIYTTPAPGAVALIGVAGLVGSRRRR